MLPKTTPRPALGAAVTAVKAVALLVLAAVTVLALVTAGDGRTHDPVATDESPISWQDDRLERMMAAHRCSTTGFGTEHVPGSAIVLRDGEPRHVSFDRGWAVFSGKREGTLVAVCLDDR